MLKNILLVIFCLLFSVPSFSRNEVRIVIKSTEAGRLKDLITRQGHALSEVDCLTIEGPINTQDIRMIVVEMEQLRELDLENTTVVAGEYRASPNSEIHTSRGNVLSFGLYIVCSFRGGEPVIPKKLETIVLPQDVEELSDGIFSGYNERYSLLSGEIRLPRTIKRIGREVFTHTGISYAVPLPESLEYIGSANILAEGTLQLPPNLSFLDVTQFQCPNTTSFAISENNPHYAVVDGVLFNKDKTVLFLYPKGREGKYEIPPFVKKIGTWAFYGCNGLTEIELHEGLEEMVYPAFVTCKKLRKAKLNGNKHLKDALKDEMFLVYRNRDRHHKVRISR